MSVRSTARFGGPAVAGIAFGDGFHVWLITAVVSAALVGAVILLHIQPGWIGSLRRLVRRR